jgi:hypothetical protein
VVGTLVVHKERPPAPPPRLSAAPTATQAEPSPAVLPADADAPAAPVAVSSAAGEAAQTATATPVATTPAPARMDLAGTWRGAYVDASGKQLLRIVSLSISSVHDDGGIEGTLRYEAASGEGQCRLYPRGSTYSAGEQRLQLSPEGCSAHYPKELGVPLDFDAVNPQGNALKNGRIEAPTGEIIKVILNRVSGV